MEQLPLPLHKLQELCPNCPRTDNQDYLADDIIRRILDGKELSGLPDEFIIEAGIGTLIRESGNLIFLSAVVMHERSEPDMNIAGTRLWKMLHEYAINWNLNVDEQSVFLSEFIKKIPCKYCSDYWIEMVTATPPLTDSARSFFEWTVSLHNQVNRKLSKPEIAVDDATTLYNNNYNFFDRVVVINLDRRTDRMEEFNQEMAKCAWSFRKAERMSAVDASKLPVPVGWNAGDGAWGCMQSHRHILERAILDGADSILVLEDDVMFVEGFAEKMKEFLANVPADWDQLMIGGQLFGDSTTEEVAPGVLKVTNCQRTHCYAVRGQYMRDLYSKWCASYGHCDHVMGPFQVGRNVYAPKEFLAGQRDGYSDISGSDNPAKLWVAPDAGEPIYWVKTKDRREVETLRRNGYHGGRNRNAQGVDVGLDEIVKLVAPDAVKVSRLKEWITMIKWESRSMTPVHKAMLWHPEIQEVLVRAAAGESLEIL